jgi:extracellular elastinolytic metalloproteinase
MRKTNRVLSEALEVRQLLASALVDSSTLASSIREWGDEGLLISYSPAGHFVRADSGMLSGKVQGAPLDVAMSYLRDNAAVLGLSSSDVTGSRVTSQYTDSDTGVTHIYLQQTLRGLPVLGADLGIHLTQFNEVINVGGGFVPGLGKLGGNVPAAQISALGALTGGARALGMVDRSLPMQVDGDTFEDSDLSQDPIDTQLVYVARDEGPRLAWMFRFRLPAPSSDWYELAVDAGSGETIWAHNYTSHASYNVYAAPTEAPSFAGRTLVNDPSDVTASPFGWHDNNGVAGPEFTDTRGNNVSAQDDIDANNTGGTRPDGGASLNFDFAVDLAQAPSTYRPAAITNLFYWNNLLHDVHYRYGFTEAAGSFQTNNYGNGGNGNDAVQADAQDGAGTNNANFATPPDGSAGRMQMYVWTRTSPSRDGDFDNGIMIHEYGHGVSTRLTGGPANSTSLDATQSGGMGEGWSDFWALALTADASNVTTLSRGMGTYAYGQATSGSGIRRYKYAYNMSVNPLTVDAFGVSGTTSYGTTRSTEVHNTGEIWCTVLWDLHTLLVQKYGFNADIASGYTTSAGSGNKLTLKLVMDALKLQPSNPTFAQARDAILQADEILTGAANRAEIWQAFARRGMGFSFNSGASSSATSVTAAFDIPWVDPVVLSSTPVGTLVGPVSSMTFKFSEPMDPASFSIASDVLSFTGPGGANLLSQVSGFSFNPAGTQLTVNFSPQAVVGSYSMTIGPDILSADNQHAMDQDRDTIPGEPGDTYTGSFSYATQLSDSYGYTAGAWGFEALDLVYGSSGVTRILENNDDTSASIPIGTNSFRFYNTTYNSSSTVAIGASENGFVSFGNLSTVSANTDLTSPSAARVAALWDDWVTNQSSTDQVLYKYEDLNNDGTSDRLIVEWNDVEGWESTGNGLTFQAVLQLNTGTRPGTILLNYVDTDAGDAGYSNGIGATVGLKDTGTPPSQRFVLSQDDANFPWVGSGKAIRISTDWVAPTAAASYNFNEGPPQTLKYQFSEDVSASLSTADLVLFNHTTNSVVPNTGVTLSYNPSTNLATFNLSGALPDGDYTATLVGAGITDPSWMPMAADVKLDFFFLAGDATRDRFVDTQDFNVLVENFGLPGKVFTDGDFTYDSIVDSSDFNVLVAQFGKRLSPTPAPGVSSGSTLFAAGDDADRDALVELS